MSFIDFSSKNRECICISAKNFKLFTNLYLSAPLKQADKKKTLPSKCLLSSYMDAWRIHSIIKRVVMEIGTLISYGKIN